MCVAGSRGGLCPLVQVRSRIATGDWARSSDRGAGPVNMLPVAASSECLPAVALWCPTGRGDECSGPSPPPRRFVSGPQAKAITWLAAGPSAVSVQVVAAGTGTPPDAGRAPIRRVAAARSYGPVVGCSHGTPIVGVDQRVVPPLRALVDIPVSRDPDSYRFACQ